MEETMLPAVHEGESHPEQLWSHCWEQKCPRRDSNPSRPLLSQPLFWANQAALFIIVITVDVILAQTLAKNKACVTEEHSTFFGLSLIQTYRKYSMSTAGALGICSVCPPQFLNIFLGAVQSKE